MAISSFIRVEWLDGWCRSTGDEYVGEQDFPWTVQGEKDAEKFADKVGGHMHYFALQ